MQYIIEAIRDVSIASIVCPVVIILAVLAITFVRDRWDTN